MLSCLRPRPRIALIKRFLEKSVFILDESRFYFVVSFVQLLMKMYIFLKNCRHCCVACECRLFWKEKNPRQPHWTEWVWVRGVRPKPWNRFPPEVRPVSTWLPTQLAYSVGRTDVSGVYVWRTCLAFSYYEALLRNVCKINDARSFNIDMSSYMWKLVMR